MIDTPRAQMEKPVVAKAVVFLPRCHYPEKGIREHHAIPKEAVYPGKHILKERNTNGTIMESLLSLAKKRYPNEMPAAKIGSSASKVCRPYRPIKTHHQIPTVKHEPVRIQILKQYLDPEREQLQLWGYYAKGSTLKYIRHRDMMDRRVILNLQGRIKRKKVRRSWIIGFDELERQHNRLIFGKSILHPALGHMNLDQFSYVAAQAWSDYEACDFSDFFTLGRLLSYLRPDLATMIPKYVILHDFMEYKVYEPPGFECSFEEVFREISNSEID